jgi:hypothetical protein
MDRQNQELRSQLLEESKRTVLAELTSKSEAELMAKELKMEKDVLERKNKQAMAQISELSGIKERYSQMLSENTTAYKIELNKEHQELLASITIEKSKLESDRIVLLDRQKVSEQLFAQSRAISDEAEDARENVKKLKARLVECEMERDKARESARDLELKVNVQHNSTSLEFELSSLKR